MVAASPALRIRPRPYRYAVWMSRGKRVLSASLLRIALVCLMNGRKWGDRRPATRQGQGEADVEIYSKQGQLSSPGPSNE